MHACLGSLANHDHRAGLLMKQRQEGAESINRKKEAKNEKSAMAENAGRNDRHETGFIIHFLEEEKSSFIPAAASVRVLRDHFLLV